MGSVLILKKYLLLILKTEVAGEEVCGFAMLSGALTQWVKEAVTCSLGLERCGNEERGGVAGPGARFLKNGFTFNPSYDSL